MITGVDAPPCTSDAGDVPRDPKPCCRRIGKRLWCCLPDGHLVPGSEHYTPDCAGVGIEEFPVTDYGPQWRPEWSKRK